MGVGLSALTLKFMWVTVSLAAVVAAAVLSTIILIVFSQIMPTRTTAGARAREATLGSKEFLGRVEEERYKKRWRGQWQVANPRTQRYLCAAYLLWQ